MRKWNKLKSRKNASSTGKMCAKEEWRRAKGKKGGEVGGVKKEGIGKRRRTGKGVIGKGEGREGEVGEV